MAHVMSLTCFSSVVLCLDMTDASTNDTDCLTKDGLFDNYRQDLKRNESSTASHLGEESTTKVRSYN